MLLVYFVGEILYTEMLIYVYTHTHTHTHVHTHTNSVFPGQPSQVTLFLVQLIGNLQWCIKLLFRGRGDVAEKFIVPAEVCDGIHDCLFVCFPSADRILTFKISL